MGTIEQVWKNAIHSPVVKIIEHLDRLIPDVPLTPELKLWYAIFGERHRNHKYQLIEAFLSIHEPKGEWEDYKNRCAEWVTGLLQASIKYETDLIKDDIRLALTTIKEREQQMLQLRFGFDGQSQTLAQVAPHLNVTRERIRQIEAKALRKLRHQSRSRGLKRRWPGEWLREKVFHECAGQSTVPVLFLYWNQEREELKYVKTRRREAEEQIGREVQAAIDKMKHQYSQMENRISYLKSLVKVDYQKPITEIGLSQRVVNALIHKFGRYPEIPTLGEVAVLSDEELLMTRNFGQGCLAELREMLKSVSV